MNPELGCCLNFLQFYDIIKSHRIGIFMGYDPMSIEINHPIEKCECFNSSHLLAPNRTDQ